MKFEAKILRKYLDGKFSLNDKIQVDEYFDNEKHASQLDRVLNEHWRTAMESSEKDLNPVLDRINHQILLSSTQQSTKLKRLWQAYSKIASVLLIPILLTALYFLSDFNNNSKNVSWVEVHSPYGARTKFTLPDGSSGWLNGGSMIKYPAVFGINREVKLNGEAFFEVVKNPKSPFVVDVNQLTIKVLGTSFNVVSYDQDSISEVVVATGRVEVATNNKNKEKMVLLPSDRLVMNKLTTNILKSTVEIQNYTSWKNGQLIFMNDNLDEAIRKISRYYNVDFKIDYNVNRKQLFRAIMDDESLEDVLSYMSLTMDILCHVNERKTDASGIVLRKEVEIRKALKNN